ncbi:hypothetical protein SAMN04487950_3966 [Halogranum rubrum]|uniref:MYM-type Zinc finger with FCS sequence motif-containing protein n=2 Tax=Halogranum rubrum TaxID=553466 RepID=A0A1I4I6C8_9EURY|nr:MULTISPECIES: hypothetical protein [Halogranum]EJN61092.1 hypothetical protein HSB1_01330 [Halogranum salarium B-1]SFL49321.1 hypothetical protein SAMN04487950_3966 [Halogranum rubrum]
MSKSSRGAAAPSLGPGWTVQQVVERSFNSGGTDTCTKCGASVDLGERHHRVDVAQDVELTGRRLRSKHEQLVFCSADCADGWIQQ